MRVRRTNRPPVHARYRGKLCIYSGDSLAEMEDQEPDINIDLVLCKGTVTFRNMPIMLRKLLKC